MTLLEQYKRDGYVVLPDAFDAGAAFDPVAFTAQCQKYNAEYPNAIRKLARIMAQSAVSWGVFMSPKIFQFVIDLGFISPVFTTHPVSHFMGFDPTFDGTHAHQDWPALQTSLNAVTVWFPLHDVGLDNFPVEVVPGSHLRGLLPAKAGEHYSEVETEGMEFVPVPVPFGSVLLFSGFTVHRTRFPGTGTRMAFSHRYEDGLEQAWQERGYPSAQRRVIDREVKWTPTVEQVRAVFA